MKNLLLPPYTKHHIIAAATITFFVAIGLLFYINSHRKNPQVTNQPTAITASQLQQQFAEPLAMAQQDQGLAAWTQGKFVIFDLRPATDYAAEHLVGSINLSPEDLKNSVLDPQVDIILYSSNQDDLNRAGQILRDKNIRQIRLLNQPLSELQSQGLQLTSDPS